MKLLKKLLSKLNGLHYPQEYLCFGKESFENPLHAYLIADGKIIKDITKAHLFTGYCPLIITLHSPASEESRQAGNNHALPDSIEVIFSRQSLQPNEFLGKKDAIARLSLKMIRRQSVGDTDIAHYEGIKGKHHFLSSFHQFIIGLNNRLYNKKPGNVYLHGNLYKQVQIAYSLPRVISLITVSEGKAYNLFPSDLHGAINEQYYMGSLRHEGKACKQVEAAGRIVISQIHCDAYKSVYLLGKNHMQEFKPKDNFAFGSIHSSFFQLPLPASALNYRELELMDSFEHGIHKIMLFKIVSRQTVDNDPATLAHVHNCYATWRYKQKFSSNFLLRLND